MATSRQPQLSNSETHVFLSWIRFVTSNPFRRFEPAFGLQKGMTGGMDPPSRLSGSPLPSETETVTESRRWVSLSKGRMPGVVDPAGGGACRRACWVPTRRREWNLSHGTIRWRETRQTAQLDRSIVSNQQKEDGEPPESLLINLAGRARPDHPTPVSSSGTSIRTLYTVQVLFRTISNLCRALLVVTFFREGP